MHSNGTLTLPLDTRCVYTLTARPGGLSVQGKSIQGRGGLCPEGSLSGKPPTYGKERAAVRILLECFLVSENAYVDAKYERALTTMSITGTGTDNIGNV